MFTRRSALVLLCPLALVTSTGCGDVPFSGFFVKVVATDTGLGVPNATVQVVSFSQTTDATGVATFSVPSTNQFPHGNDTITVTADGYEKTTIGVKDVTKQHDEIISSQTVTVSLTRTAPALVFHTFSGSVANPIVQTANVQITYPDSTTKNFPTIDVGNGQYAVVTVPNLTPDTYYPYTVSAPGFTNVTDKAKTPLASANPLYTEVDVLLTPPTPVVVEFQTAAVNPGVVGQQFGTEAIVTVTPGNLSVKTVPVRGTNQYYSETLSLLSGTPYHYSAFFTQFGLTVEKDFTPSGPGPYVVPIVLNPFALPAATSGGNALPSKVLP